LCFLFHYMYQLVWLLLYSFWPFLRKFQHILWKTSTYLLADTTNLVFILQIHGV
jgi:hypothetical protein